MERKPMHRLQKLSLGKPMKTSYSAVFVGCRASTPEEKL